MLKMNKKEREYNLFHNNTTVQSKIISKNNFTYRNLIGFIEKYLKNTEQNVVDIGCGAGTVCFYIAQKGNKILGIDISSKAIELCHKSSITLGLDKNTKFKVVNFPEETVKGKFDLIIFSEVIEHLSNDKLALKRICKLLNVGGIVIITTPSLNAPLYKLGYAKDFDKRVGHLRRYTIEGLSKKCNESGLNIIEAKKIEGIFRNFLYINPNAGKTIRFIKFFMSDIVTFIDNISIVLFGESNIVVVAQRTK